MAGGPPTVGVEEEFFLLDPATGEVACLAPQVIEACADGFGVAAECMRYMIETRTPVCQTLDEIGDALLSRRRQVAAEADRHGAVAISSGVAPYGIPDAPTLTPDPRYGALLQAFPSAMRTAGTCACHVHVGVRDHQAAVEALARVRPWLPVLAALTANSPVVDGVDSGWASARHRFMTRWPTSTPPPDVATAAEYHRAVREAVAAGRALDSRSVYFLARLSPRYPTVEVRIADGCLSTDEAVALAGLVRALVAAPAVRCPPPPRVSHGGLVVACRDAARTGLTGQLLDPLAGGRVAAWDAVDSLLACTQRRLDAHGDAERVHGVLERMRRHGGGAERQRRRFAEAASPAEFVAALVAETMGCDAAYRRRVVVGVGGDLGDDGRQDQARPLDLRESRTVELGLRPLSS